MSDSTPDDRESLLDSLRGSGRRSSVNAGCGTGVCGACTVLAEVGPIRSCLALARDGSALGVRTLEDLSATPIGAAVARVFADRHALQCGYCTPGFLVTAIDMVESRRPQSLVTIRAVVADNLCRCTGYAPIVEAFRRIAEDAGLWIDDSAGPPGVSEEARDDLVR